MSPVEKSGRWRGGVNGKGRHAPSSIDIQRTFHDTKESGRLWLQYSNLPLLAEYPQFFVFILIVFELFHFSVMLDPNVSDRQKIIQTFLCGQLKG